MAFVQEFFDFVTDERVALRRPVARLGRKPLGISEIDVRNFLVFEKLLEFWI
jgi:hypothetical protein